MPFLTEQRAAHAKEIGCYSVFYVMVFAWLERRITFHYYISCRFDDLIPFCRFFVVPYLLWFAYVAVTLLYFGFINTDEEEYRRLSRTLFIGCTLFLIISFVFPNVQMLRPYVSGSDVFSRLVRLIYSMDTSRNVFPSIHVFNAIACNNAWCHTASLKHPIIAKRLSTVLAISIVLSTMFIKQHTVLDVLGAIALNMACFLYFYVPQQQGREAKMVLRR